MLTTQTLEAHAQALRARLTGELALPGEESWDEARQAWNLAVDQQPGAVVLAETAGDVVAVVEFARENGMRVAPQGTGHNAGAMKLLADTILLKTNRMRGVEVDPVARVARAEAGAIWADVNEKLLPHGLWALSGSAHDVGVVGYCLGGGLSFLSRSLGLAASSVIAIELVTADGEFRRVDSANDPELFWALRGGGGSFAAVTAIEFRVYPIEQVYAGMLAFPWERAAEVLHTWREMDPASLPDESTVLGRILQVPPLPDIPEPLRGRQFVVVEVVHLGDEASGDALVEPLRALGPEIDTAAMGPAAALQHLHMDPPQPVPGAGDYAMVGELTPEAIDAFVDSAGPESGSPLLSVELRPLGGALARPREDHGARGTFDARYTLFAVGMAMTPEMKAAVKAHAAGVVAAMEPHRAREGYINFAENSVDASELFADRDAYERLRAIKSGYDPQDVFRSNHPIPGAR
jgi:FAD/FMN-containing dehydrogenase